MNAAVTIQAAPIVTADNFEGLVRDELGKIGEGFLRLGFYFEQAKTCRLYEPLGYGDVFELAEDLFDLKESSVYDMMAVWRCFHSIKNPLALRDDCKGLKYSQLVECLRDKWGNGNAVRVISSSDTVKETRAKVTAWNTLAEKLSGYPSLEQVEDEVERQKMRKEREQAERENSRRLESSAPELVGQLPGQTSIFVEGIAEAPSEKPEKFQTSGILEEAPAEDPFAELPKETAIYAQALVQESLVQHVEIYADELFPSENQMNIHKRQALSYIEIMGQAKNAEGVDNFFEKTIKRLVAMRACKLQALKVGKK